jgi:hypothetical protein
MPVVFFERSGSQMTYASTSDDKNIREPSDEADDVYG